MIGREPTLHLLRVVVQVARGGLILAARTTRTLVNILLMLLLNLGLLALELLVVAVNLLILDLKINTSIILLVVDVVSLDLVTVRHDFLDLVLQEVL